MIGLSQTKPDRCIIDTPTQYVYIIFNWQDGLTPFQCAVEKERSKIVKYFVEEIKVDTTVYDEVTNICINAVCK